jgi:hypothetical protein
VHGAPPNICRSLFVSGCGLVVEEGLVCGCYLLPLQWYSARCGVAVSARRGRRGVVRWCATYSSSLLGLPVAGGASTPAAPLHFTYTYMCTRFHYHLSKLAN